MSDKEHTPEPSKGSYDFSGVNNIDMKVIFAMLPEYNDDPNENRPTEELLRSSLRAVDLRSVRYVIEQHALDNLHLIIDNSDLECVNGVWQSVDVHYFDVKTRVAIKLSKPKTATKDHCHHIETIYVRAGESAAKTINNFLSANAIESPSTFNQSAGSCHSSMFGSSY